MYWYEKYSPGRLLITGLGGLLGLYLFGFFGEPPTGPVAAFFVTITLLYFAWSLFGPLIDEQFIFGKRAKLLHGLREASGFSEELRRVLARRRKKLVQKSQKAVAEAADALDKAVESRDEDQLLKALKEADRVAEDHLRMQKKGVFRDFFDTIGAALLVALMLRIFVIEAFKIPSGSMIPTLEIGDHIFVNKFSYGVAIPTLSGQFRLLDFGTPEPGDVVVFIAPEPAENAGEDFIKRVVAGPGQKIRVEDGTLYVDGVAQQRSSGEPYSYDEAVDEIGGTHRFKATRYQEQIGDLKHPILLTHLANNSWPRSGTQVNGLDCTESECTLQEGYIFCMGDNRDNSSDSRRWGAVPVKSVKGRAMFVWLSFANSARDRGILGIRWGRIGTWIK